MTSAGQRHDSLALQPLLDRLRIARRGRPRPRTRPGRLLADKAYSSKTTRSRLRRRHIQAVIPEPADQIANRRRRGQRGGRPPSFDAELYKQRNTVERAINKLRQHRAVATRYDKRDFVYRGTRRRRRHPHLAPRSRSMIYGTRPSALTRNVHRVG